MILVPVAGAAGVAYLVSNFAPEAKGHGVPEVIDAIYYNRGRIRPIVAVIKSLASALSIGSGGSVGREGPIVQIGSSFGATLGQFLGAHVWQRITLIAAGAGAGIAATFNTPVGGVLFAVEIMLHEVSARTLVPVAIATMTASYLGQLFFGTHPAFVIPAFETFDIHHPDVLIISFYVVLGVVTGLVSLVYIRSIYSFEDFFDRYVPGNYYVRHMLGMLLVGVIMYALLRTTGHYQVEGVGYATVQDVLSGQLSWALLVFFGLKLLVTSLTLGSGASGGIFSPALYLGATLGGVYGLALHDLFPGRPINPTAFAVAGMAGVVGGSTGAALAAIVMIFEMTLDLSVVIPMTIVVAISYGVRATLNPQSIYTEKLARRGHFVPGALQANFYQIKRVRDVMETRFLSVPAGGSVEEFERIVLEHPDVSCFLVEDPQGIAGFLTREAALPEPGAAAREATLAQRANRTYITVGDEMALLDVVARLQTAGATLALVSDREGPLSSRDVRGLLTKQRIAVELMEGLELFAD